MTNRQELIDTLLNIPWFLDLSPAQVEKLAEISAFKSLSAGETLFCEGDRTDNLYIVLSGEIGLEMSVPSHGRLKVFSAEALDIIGWSTLTPIVRQRTASAHACQDTRLLLLPGEALEELCELDHDMGYIIMKRIANVTASYVLMVKLHLLEQLLAMTGSIIN
jgi:CRP-like cAMP-binding protein